MIVSRTRSGILLSSKTNAVAAVAIACRVNLLCVQFAFFFLLHWAGGVLVELIPHVGEPGGDDRVSCGE
jgi:hypothetical protein